MYMIEKKGDYDTCKSIENPRCKNTIIVFINMLIIVAIDKSVDKLDSKIKFTYFP